MKEIIAFLKDIFLLQDDSKVGLSQLGLPSKSKLNRAVKETEVRLSDLVRGRG